VLNDYHVQFLHHFAGHGPPSDRGRAGKVAARWDA